MTTAPIYFDLTELLNNPVRTGIQRVSLSILEHWPRESSLVLFCLKDNVAFQLPAQAREVLVRFFHASQVNLAESVAAIRQLTTPPPKNRADNLAVASPLNYLDLCKLSSCPILNAEVFYDQRRIDFYHDLLDQGARHIYFLVYDMLPWFQPNWFPPGAVLGTMPYTQLLRRIPYTSYISSQTRRAFHTRFLREPETRGGPVIPLGADGLGHSLPQAATNNRFVACGTLEPRKNHRAIVEAFVDLWRDNSPAELLLLGNRGWLNDDDRDLIDNLQRSEPRFSWIAGLSDAEVATHIRGSRASLYCSLAEGYGLPPAESLALGVPAIVTHTLPSVEMLPDLGQIRIDPPTPEAIRAAVLMMLNEVTYRQKLREVAEIQPLLPTWGQIGQHFFDWIAGQSTSRLVA